MRRSLAIILIAGLSIPAFAFANNYSLLQKDVLNFQTVLRQDAGDAMAEKTQMNVESGSALFPDPAGLPDKPNADPESASPFVTFRENGILVVLKDVPRSQWFGPYVRDMVDRRIVSGYRNADGTPTGLFGPERNVSVEELAKMSVEAAGIDQNTCPATAKNVTAQGSWSVAYIACTEKLAWALYGDSTVDVKRPATRAEVVMTLLQALDAPFRPVAGSGSVFKDVGPTTQFSSAIVTAAADGVVAGYTDANGNLTGMFGPGNAVNRAELSKMFSIALQLYKR